MPEFVIDRLFLQEIQSDWLRISEEVQATDDIEKALFRVDDLRAFLTPFINEILFDRELWSNKETRGEESNANMARIRFELDTYLTQIQEIVNSMEDSLKKNVRLLTPGSKEYEEDGGKTDKELKERGVDPAIYTWNRSKGPFFRSFDKISGIMIDKVFPFLEKNLPVFEEFYKEGYEEELAVDDVVVTFSGNKPCTLSKVRRCMEIIKETAQKIKNKNLDKIWEGRIYVHCGRRDKEKQFGVQYFSPPKDVVYIYENPGPFLGKALLYAFGNKYYYGNLPVEKRRKFQEVMNQPEKTSWGFLTKKEKNKDFAGMFVDYVEGRLSGDELKKFEFFLKEDFFRKLIEEQSKTNEGFPEEQEKAMKLASRFLYLRRMVPKRNCGR